MENNIIKYSKFKFLGQLFYKKIEASLEFSKDDFNNSETIRIKMSSFYPHYMGEYYIHDVHKKKGLIEVRLQKKFDRDEEKMETEWLKGSISEFILTYKYYEHKIMLCDSKRGILFKK